MICAYLTTVAKSPTVVSPSAKAGDTAKDQGSITMPTGPNWQKRPADAIGLAVHIAKIATGEIEDTSLKQPAKRASGLAGAKARHESTTPERRAEIARAAANARWE
jgi:hypothetical protein